MVFGCYQRLCHRAATETISVAATRTSAVAATVAVAVAAAVMVMAKVTVMAMPALVLLRYLLLCHVSRVVALRTLLQAAGEQWPLPRRVVAAQLQL